MYYVLYFRIIEIRLQNIISDVMIQVGKAGVNMSMIGYYNGTAVRVDEPLQMNQKVIVIPVENETDLGKSAAGGLHKYANPSLIEQEKDAWRNAAIRKHAEE